MNARSWLIPMLLATLPIASAYAALPGAATSATSPGFNDVAYLVPDTRSGVALLSDFSTSILSTDGHGMDAYGMNVHGMDAHGISVANADSEICRSGNCVRVLQAQFAPFGDRGKPESSGMTDGMTQLDLALMMLFGVALVAYQLDRKQRLLRQSALIPTSVD